MPTAQYFSEMYVVIPNYAAEIPSDQRSSVSLTTFSGANVLASEIASAYDHDWFRVALQTGHQYRFNAGGFDTTLALRDATGQQLAFNDDSNGSFNSEITFLATATGTYYLDVSGCENSIGIYLLQAIDITPPTHSPADILASSQTSATLVVGASTSSNIGFVNDHDWFRIDLQAGHQYRFNAGGFDSTLALRNAAGQQLAFNDDSNGTLNSEITFSVTSTGTYFLDVAGWASNGLGAYTLQAVMVA